jgi:hypothetical protein
MARPRACGQSVEIYAAAFPDMHRELYRFFVHGDTVIIEPATQGTHKGPLDCHWEPYTRPATNSTHSNLEVHS